MDNEKPDTTAERPAKNLLGIPWRLAFALQEEGGILRQEVIWKKGFAHPELVKDRCTRTHETVFRFSKLPLYFYDADAIRVPAVSASHARGQPKPGLLRRDADSEMRTNPIGRNSGTVWEVNTISYPGPHTATFPPDLVRMVSCDDDLLVLDPFGGAVNGDGSARTGPRRDHHRHQPGVHGGSPRTPWRHRYRPSGSSRLRPGQITMSKTSAIRSVRSDVAQVDAGGFFGNRTKRHRRSEWHVHLLSPEEIKPAQSRSDL